MRLDLLPSGVLHLPRSSSCTPLLFAHPPSNMCVLPCRLLYSLPRSSPGPGSRLQPSVLAIILLEAAGAARSAHGTGKRTVGGAGGAARGGPGQRSGRSGAQLKQPDGRSLMRVWVLWRYAFASVVWLRHATLLPPRHHITGITRAAAACAPTCARARCCRLAGSGWLAAVRACVRASRRRLSRRRVAAPGCRRRAHAHSKHNTQPPPAPPSRAR